MSKISIIIAVLLMGSISYAQEWVEHGGVEYNCDILNQILANYGEDAFMRSSGGTTTLADFSAMFFPVCPETSLTISLSSTPNASVDPTATLDRYVDSPNVCLANIRSCPATSCEILEKLTHRQSLKVVASEGNWSQIRVHDLEQAYIHNDLVAESLPDYGNCRPTPVPTLTPTPLPYGRISAHEFYYDSENEGFEANIEPINLSSGLWSYEFKAGQSHVILSADTSPEDCAGLVPFYLDTGRERIARNCTVYFSVSNNPRGAGWYLYLYKEAS